MKLNFHQAWHYHKIAKIKQPFKLWIKAKKQGKMKFFGEIMENGMYDVPEADDNKEFKKWILNERRNMKKEDRQIMWKAKKNKVTALMSYYGFYNGKELFVIQEDIMFHLIGMDIPSDIPYIDSFFTLKSAKHGAERFLKRLQEAGNRKEEIMKKEDRQIIWKLDWLCYAGFYKGYKIFECFEWEKSQWEVNLILGNFKTKIGTYTTCRSAKRGAERFLKKLQKQLSEK